MAPDLDPVLDPVLDKVLAEYSQVEPPPQAVQAWLARRAPPRPSNRFLWLPAPAWAAIAFALLLMLAVTWYRGRPQANSRPLLANERTVVVPLDPNQAPPLTDEQKQLIQLLQTDPAALATKQPSDLNKAKKKHP
ncbi:MAG TPA: hypothetical protein VNF74_07275 [Terriglobales bacterium]|nr:hypothetical protein [Terriglobales bacterium]